MIRILELIAALAGVVSVYLSARQNIWNWPTAIVNVLLYAIVFEQTGLYSDMGLQFVFLVLTIYGWYEWLYGGANRTELKVSRASWRDWSIATPIGILFWIILGRNTARLPGVALPYLDAGLATASLVAQWLMTRKVLEHWIIWILVDTAYIPMYIYKQLSLTAALYAVFLVLAVMGFRSWRRSYRVSAALPTAG